MKYTEVEDIVYNKFKVGSTLLRDFVVNYDSRPDDVGRKIERLLLFVAVDEQDNSKLIFRDLLSNREYLLDWSKRDIILWICEGEFEIIDL